MYLSQSDSVSSTSAPCSLSLLLPFSFACGLRSSSSSSTSILLAISLWPKVLARPPNLSIIKITFSPWSSSSSSISQNVHGTWWETSLSAATIWLAIVLRPGLATAGDGVHTFDHCGHAVRMAMGALESSTWWDPIIPTPRNWLSIHSFCQMGLDLSLFRQFLHPPSVHHTYHSRPHYTSITHCNSETRYWSEAFAVPNPTIIPSCLSTGYSTVQCILSVWTFTYTSILSDFLFSFTLFRFV